jgi:soluble lytic murein transglycosylase
MLYDPATNIKYGTYYLSYLYGVYARWPTVYAAYNAGPSAVDRWLEDKAYSDDGTNLEKIPYPETEAFVSRVERAAETYLRLYYKD